jgi:pimeloyl-ACP methyl ester carboxylesterase
MRVPALVIHDRNDQEIPVAEGQAIAAAWPGANTLFTERYGHRRILIARDVIKAVVNFLTTDLVG